MNRLSVTTDRGSQWKYSLLVLMVSNNKPNIINLTRDSDTELHVDFTKEMLPVNGRYIMQFEYTDGNVVGHTDKFDAFVNDVINTEDTWVDIPSEFEQLRQEIMQNAIIAQNAANEAKKISQEIKIESDKAVQAAKDAQQYAQQAQQAVDLAQEAQRLAQEAKNQAVLSATEAEQSAIQANQSKTEAAESATQANQAKTEAKESATQASQSATQANLSKDEAKKAQLASEKARDESQAILEQIQSIKVEVDGIVAQINDARDKALQAIETNKNSAVESVNNAGTNNVANVNQAGATQVKAVNDAGVEQVQAVTNEGNKQVGLVTSEGTKQVQAVTTEGTNQLQSIRNEGSKQVQSITTEGTTQVKNVSDEGDKQVQAVTAQGETQTNLVSAEGTKQVGLVNTAGQEQVKAVNDAGAIQTANAKEQADRAKTEADRAEKAADGVQDIASSIDRLAIHETAEGNPVIIKDSADWQMEGLRVYGQSEQVTTTGAQMFDASTRIVGGIINNGVQASNSRYACSDYIPIPDGTSHLYQSGGALNQRGFYGVDEAYLSKPNTNNVIDVPEGAKYIRITSNIDQQDMRNIMLCVGNTATAYEPYTGGKPAPSPEYPQEIVSKTVDEIVVTGKNLINQPTLSFTHFTKIDLTNPLRPGTYTFSGVATTEAESDALLISCLDDAGKLVVSVYLPVDGRKHYTVSVSRRVAALQIYAARNNALAIKKNAQLRDLQIELGSVASPYEPYHAQTVTLSAPVTLRGVPVKTGGNVTINGQMYVSDVVMETRSLISVKRRTKQIHLTGDELWHTWGTHESGNIGFYMYYNQSVDSEFIRNGGALCSIAVPNSSAFGGGQPGCWVASSPKPDEIYIIISVPQSSLTDVSTKQAAIQSFKDLLKKLGNVEFLAMLYEPSFEPLPETDQAIRELRTYHGNTVVTTGAWTETDYVADPKLYIDNKIKELSAAIVAR